MDRAQLGTVPCCYSKRATSKSLVRKRHVANGIVDIVGDSPPAATAQSNAQRLASVSRNSLFRSRQKNTQKGRGACLVPKFARQPVGGIEPGTWPTTSARIVGIVYLSRTSAACAASSFPRMHEIIVCLSSGSMSDRDDGVCRLHGASTMQSQAPTPDVPGRPQRDTH